MQNLENKEKKAWAVVTGASRGIGKAIAGMLALHGYNLIINCRSRILDLQKTEEELKASGVEVLSVCGTILPEHIEGKDIRVLVNNAGISRIGLFQDTSDEQWQEMLACNLTTVFQITRLVLPEMIRAGRGDIINISSIWGTYGGSCEVVYSTTKGGINAFTKALAKEVAPSKIKVNAIACGAIDTEMNAWLSEEEKQALSDEIPAGRMGTTEEVAQMVWSILIAPEYMTAQIITLDGGMF